MLLDLNRSEPDRWSLSYGPHSMATETHTKAWNMASSGLCYISSTNCVPRQRHAQDEDTSTGRFRQAIELAAPRDEPSQP